MVDPACTHKKRGLLAGSTCRAPKDVGFTGVQVHCFVDPAPTNTPQLSDAGVTYS